MAGRPFRGAVVLVNLEPVVGHEQGRIRPCVVVQNDVGNRYSTTTVIVPLTDAAHIKKPSPIYIFVKKGDGGATKDSYVLCDQIRTVDHKRLLKSLGILAPETIAAVDNAMLISLALPGVSIPNR